MRKTASILVLCLSIACSDPNALSTNDETTLVGSWRFTTEEHSGCAVPADDQVDTCGGTPIDCGILTFTETAWTLAKSGPHGSEVSQGGGYTVAGSTISFTGGGPGGSSPSYTLSGSSITYSSTLLTFRTTDFLSGCTITISYSRYRKPPGTSN